MKWCAVVLAAMTFLVISPSRLARYPAQHRLDSTVTTVEGFTAADEFVHYAEPRDVTVADMRLLDRPQVAQLFGRYRYSWRGTPWQFQEITSPLVHRFVAFLYSASEGLDNYSDLTVILNRDEREMYLIPIQNHGMVRYCNVEDDPHNIAIFNALIAGEDMRPAGAVDWLRLALLYLNLVGERHQISDWQDFSGVAHSGLLNLLPKLKRLGLLPQVQREDGKCDVRVIDLYPDGAHRVIWDLEFDSHTAPPRLNVVTRELGDLNEPGSSQR